MAACVCGCERGSNHGKMLVRVECVDKVNDDSLSVGSSRDEFRSIVTALYQIRHRIAAHAPLKMIREHASPDCFIHSFDFDFDF